MTSRPRLRPAVLAVVLALGACGGEPPGADRSGSAPESFDPAPGAASGEATGRSSSERESGYEPAQEPARDVLLVTVDTLRADALGFAGNARVATPVLDRLASQSRVFIRAHAHNVVTLPSHANLLTGRLPFEHGVRDNAGFVLPESFPTAATLFAEAGFATAAVVGAFPLDARFGLDRGFAVYDDRYPEGSKGTDFRLVERRGDEVVDRARSWWAEHEDERRFLWVHLFDPHAPYEPPEPWASRFRDDPYLGEVAATDAFLGPLLEPILEDGSTLVVFTSDHGEALGDHGEMTHGLFAYEATLRVPLLVRAPGAEPLETDAPARHIDVLPTLLRGAGLAVPEDLPGVSLLSPSGGLESSSTYFEALSANLNRGWAPLRGVIRSGHKLISLPLPELYDLAADPAERTNLLDASKGEGMERAAARRRARELADLLPEDRPIERHVTASADADALRSLGYLSGAASRKETYTAEDDPKNLAEIDREIFRFIDLYQRGRLEAATEKAREIITRAPDMSAGYYNLAQVLLEREQPGEALEVLRRAVDRGVQDSALLRQLGLLLAEAGRSGEAVELLRPYRPTGDPDLLNALGLALSEAGRHAEARAVLEEVFAHDPRNPTAHEHLALVALRSQRFDVAERQALRALELNAKLAQSWNYLAVARYNLGRPREAVLAWERALEVEPRSYDVLFNLGLVAAETGDAERARRALARFAEEAPSERYANDLRKVRALLAELERSPR